MNSEKIPTPNNEENQVENSANAHRIDKEFSTTFKIDNKLAKATEKIDHEDEIYEQYEKFLDSMDDENFFQKYAKYWHDNFSNNPNLFYGKENFKTLHNLEPAERFARFFRSTRSLYVTPKMVQEYFNEFPDDLIMATNLYNEKGGRPETCLELEFFGTIAPSINDKIIKKDYHFEDNLYRAERKNAAPNLLLGNYQTEKLHDEVFGKFDKAAEGFKKTFAEAAELNWGGKYRLNPNKMFTPEYEKLNDSEKSEFLRLCLNETHNALVFDEVWNSAFTKEMADRQNKKSDHTHLFFHNVAHSMVYKTYQPLSAFHRDQDYYSYEMNNTATGGGYTEEYPFQRLILAVVDKLGKTTSDKDNNVDLLVNFWNKNRNPIFANAVADALSQQNPTRGASKLLECIRQEKEDKRALAAILYRLELGQLSISSEGALYLEKMYDLGLYNNPDYHVQRLTPNGEIGVFNEDKELIKYFELGDLTSEEKKIKAQVLDISYDTLFFDKEDETNEERQKRLGYLEEFKKHYYNLAQDQIFKETEVQLNNLSFREQGWFLIKFNNSSNEEKDNIKEFLKDYGENGIKSFLALEYGNELGAKILQLGENHDKQLAESIFREFSAITTAAQQITNQINNTLQGFANPDFFGTRIFENLIRQAKNYLVAAHDIQTAGQGIIYSDGKFIQLNSSNQPLAGLCEIKQDLRAFAGATRSFEDLNDIGLPLLDKYLFDSKNTEQIKQQSLKIYIDGSPAFKKDLENLLAKHQEIICLPKLQHNHKEFPFAYIADASFDEKIGLPDIILQEKNELEGNAAIFADEEANIGQIYKDTQLEIAEAAAKGRKIPKHYLDQLKKIENYLKKLPLRVTVARAEDYTNTLTKTQAQQIRERDEPELETEQTYRDYHAVILDQQKNIEPTILFLKDLIYTRKNKPDIHFDEANLKAYEQETFAMQEHPYEINESNAKALTLIEEKTANTTQCLKHLFDKIKQHDYHSVLDLGTGEGRIGIPLAMKGIKVTGVDQVEKELQTIENRVSKEISQTNEHGYSWRHLRKLINSGTIKESELTFDKQKVLANYQIKKGNFFELNKALGDSTETFDMATFTWHTFCETGTIDNQREVLIQVYEKLNPGGMVYIEIPDRTVGAYKYALNENLKHHPTEPVGVSRDSTCLTPGVACVYDESATPRFFPGRDEIRNLLRNLGFVDINLDTYLVTSTDQDGQQYLEVKELVVTAKKPTKIEAIKQVAPPSNLPIKNIVETTAA